MQTATVSTPATIKAKQWQDELSINLPPLTQIPGGFAAEKIGGKWVYGGGVFVACLFTLLTPWAAQRGLWPLMVVRALTGLFEGVTFPSMHAMLSRWAPPLERTTLSGLIYCGASMGTVVAMPIAGIAVKAFGS